MLGRWIIALWLLAICGTIARAENPPDPRPYLRIEAGMHIGAVKSIDVSADGRFMVTGSEDKTVRLWSLPDGRLLKVFRVPIGPGDGGAVRAVAISPDGLTIAVGGTDAYKDANADLALSKWHHVYVFDVTTGRLTRRLGPMLNAILGLKYSPDGALLAASMADGSIQIWPAPSYGRSFHTRDDAEPREYVYGLAFTASKLYAASLDGFIYEYPLPDGSDYLMHVENRVRAPDGERPFGIDASPDGKLLAVGYLDNSAVSVLSLPSLAPAWMVDTMEYSGNGVLASVAWSDDGRTLYAGGSYRDATGTYQVIAWNQSGRAPPTPLGGAHSTIFDLAALRGGGVAYGAGDPEIGVFSSGNQVSLVKKRVIADMRSKLGEDFLVSQNGAGVRFGLEARGSYPWLIDIDSLSFKPAHERPEGFVAPITSMIDVRDWEDTRQPTLGGMPLKLTGPNEVSRSLAIAPYGVQFVLGGDVAIHRFGDGGQLREPVWLGYTPTRAPAWGVNYSGDGKLVVAAIGDGTIRWYNGLGDEILAFFSNIADKRWIAWTPSGYYAASPGGEDLMGWHANGKTWDDTPQFYPASRFREQFYRPDIVQLVLKTANEADAIAQANARIGKSEASQNIEELLPATVDLILDEPQIETNGQRVKLRYLLSSPTGRAVTNVEARVDGRPVGSRGMQLVADEYRLSETLEIEVDVPPRDSEVSIIAYIGDQPSVAATVPIRWTGRVAEADKPRLYALLIGVSDYRDPSLRLNFAAKDANDLGDALRRQRGRLYRSVDVVTLLDAAASKSALEKALAQLKTKSGPDDVVVVFLAGHGMTDKALDFYFLPTNVDLAQPDLAKTALNGALIRSELAQVPGRVVLFLDACRSGAGIQGKVDMSRVSNDFAQDTGGLVMFASSQGNVDSLESVDWENGAFTEALLATLADSNAYGVDGLLSLPELEEALTANVVSLTWSRQIPVMTKYGAIPRFFIAAAP